MSEEANLRKPCFRCLERWCRVTPRPARFIIWECRVKRISFGADWDYRKGVNMPDVCNEAVMEGGWK